MAYSQEKQHLFFKTHTLFGLCIGGGCILASLLCFFYDGNIYANPGLNRMIYFIMATGLFIQIRRYRESALLEGYISFGEALCSGFWLSGVSNFIYALYIAFIYTLRPELLTRYLSTIRSITEEIRDSEVYTEMYKLLEVMLNPAIIAISNFILYFLLGAFFSLIFAAFLQKQRPKSQIRTL